MTSNQDAGIKISQRQAEGNVPLKDASLSRPQTTASSEQLQSATFKFEVPRSGEQAQQGKMDLTQIAAPALEGLNAGTKETLQQAKPVETPYAPAQSRLGSDVDVVTRLVNWLANQIKRLEKAILEKLENEPESLFQLLLRARRRRLDKRGQPVDDLRDAKEERQELSQESSEASPTDSPDSKQASQDTAMSSR